VGAFLDSLYGRHTEAHGLVVLVSHGIAINQMLNELLQFARDAAPPVVFQVENCSFSRFERRPDGTTRIMCINDTAHLASIM
jgi:broad specificity phosphatase PhoE